MKQTNSAIKFLLAQYRAIFKHAQLASILAIAAAAGLSIGQAHAAPGGASFGNTQLNDADANVTVDGKAPTSPDPAANTYQNLELTGGADRTGKDSITISITGGEGHSIKGVAATAQDPAKTDVKLGTSSITIAQDGQTAAKLTIGQSGDKGNQIEPAATNVTLNNLTVTKGTLELVADSAEANKTTVSATSMTIGGGKTPSPGDAAVKLAANSSITAGTMTVENGAAVTVSGGASLAGNTVTMNSGSVTLGTAQSADTVGAFGSSGTLEIAGGEISVAQGGAGKISGTTISVAKDGTITNPNALTIAATSVELSGTVSNEKDLTVDAKFNVKKGGTLTNSAAAASATLSKGGTFDKGAKITNSGDLIILGDTTFNSEAANITAAADSKLTVSSGATASMSAEVFKTFLTGTVQTGTDSTGTVEIASGAQAFDLATDLGIISTVPASAGTVNENLKGNGKNLTVKTASAKYVAGNEIKKATDTGNLTISVGDLTLGKTGADDFVLSGVGLEVTKSLTTTDSKAFKIDGDGSLTLNGVGSAIEAKSITVGTAASSNPPGTPASKGKLNVTKGEWSTKSLTVTAGTATVSNGAKLTLTEGLTTTGTDGKLVVTGAGSTVDAVGVKTLTLASGGVSLADAGTFVLKGDKVVDAATGDLKTGFVKGSVSGSTDTKLTLISSGTDTISMTVENYKKFRDEAGFKGIVDIKLSDSPEASGSMGLGGNDGVIAGVTNGYENTQAQVSGDVADNYYVGNVKVTVDGPLKFGADGALTLSNANANNGNGQYVTDKNGGVGSVAFSASGNTLNLEGAGGKIGSITNGADGQGSVSIGKGTDVEVVSGSIGSASSQTGAGVLGKVNVLDGGSLTVESGSVYSNNLSLGTNSSLDVGTGTVEVKEHAVINGDVKAGTLSLAGDTTKTGQGVHSIAGDANVDVDLLKLGAKNTLTIGTDGVEGQPETSSTAQVFVDYLDMGADSVVFVDPDWSKPASILATMNLGNDTSKPDTHVQSGDIFVGKNAAFGYGFDEAGLNEVLTPYLVNGDRFSKDGVKNALVIGKNLEIASGKGINVNAELTDATATAGIVPDSLKLGAGSALIITDDAFGPNKDKAAITFGKNAAAAVTAKVEAEEGAVVTLVGDISKKDTGLKLFAATANGGTAGTVSIVKDLTVEAAGGLITYKYASGSSGLDPIAWEFNPKADAHIRTRVSAPVADMFKGFADGAFDGQSGLGYDFVSGFLSAKKYEVVDVAAHAATYAGAQQAAVAAVTTMAEAVGGRVGSLGSEAAAITATGSQANGGVWLAPMYKSVDADGFGAQGVSYGADVDLAGVAFGTDTVNGNMRFGAVFNIGSGDADGKGMGDGLKDEFDYYGFGIYSVMGFGQLAIVGDASLNVISHEVEAAGLGVKAKADTTAVTMGVTGQYTISTPSVDVVPHLGARFIRLDTDSYDLSSADGAFATTDFDVQNVFSIPLGVSFSKAIEMGGWSLAPSADLSVTFNTGDVEADSTTRFHGLSHNLQTSTEVLDEVTYGVAVGLGAQYGAFGTNIGINYTGSENTDSFGVNAQARYAF